MATLIAEVDADSVVMHGSRWGSGELKHVRVADQRNQWMSRTIRRKDMALFHRERKANQLYEKGPAHAEHGALAKFRSHAK